MKPGPRRLPPQPSIEVFTRFVLGNFKGELVSLVKRDHRPLGCQLHVAPAGAAARSDLQLIRINGTVFGAVVGPTGRGRPGRRLSPHRPVACGHENRQRGGKGQAHRRRRAGVSDRGGRGRGEWPPVRSGAGRGVRSMAGVPHVGRQGAGLARARAHRNGCVRRGHHLRRRHHLRTVRSRRRRPPIAGPPKVFAVALNYRDHAADRGSALQTTR